MRISDIQKQQVKWQCEAKVISANRAELTAIKMLPKLSARQKREAECRRRGLPAPDWNLVETRKIGIAKRNPFGYWVSETPLGARYYSTPHAVGQDIIVFEGYRPEWRW